MVPRGIRNNNPFNIKKSYQSWQGETKFNSDPVFCRFCNINYGIRAGILLLKNGYLAKGFNTVDKIINRFAPSSENNSSAYIDYIVTNSPIHLYQEIEFDSLSFYHLCRCICLYESKYDLSYDKYVDVIKKFKLM